MNFREGEELARDRAEQPGATGRYRLAALVGTAVAVLLFAAVFVMVPDRLFADDTYFYYQVAWHIARGHGSTFNDLMPTNGYHPLWMVFCVGVFLLAKTRVLAVHFVAVLVSLLDATMLVLVARLIDRYARGLWPISFLLLIPFCFGAQLGTEGALSGLALALLMGTALRVVQQRTAGAAAAFSLIVGLTVLSRLDNIFITSFVWLAVWVALGDGAAGALRVTAGRRLQLVTAPIFVALWALYVGSNWMWFHTIQPISGMLKSTAGRADHRLGANLPHTALIAAAIIAVCFPVVARRSRDVFFRVVEVPFLLGILCHAFYIVFVMSSETRWTWYYTSWILLASMLLARAGAVVLGVERVRSQAIAVVLACCAWVLVPIWYKISLKKFLLGAETRPPASFNADVYGKLGIHRALAYDEPGVFAYYSDIQIVPVDGLMGDLAFQNELATKGIAEFVQREHIDGFIGPSEPVDKEQYDNLCAKEFLSSERFGCVPDGKGTYRLEDVEIFARKPPKSAGTLPLPESARVYMIPGSIAVWRLQP